MKFSASKYTGYTGMTSKPLEDVETAKKTGIERNAGKDAAF
jgi:hypothetical protein